MYAVCVCRRQLLSRAQVARACDLRELQTKLARKSACSTSRLRVSLVGGGTLLAVSPWFADRAGDGGFAGELFAVVIVVVVVVAVVVWVCLGYSASESGFSVRRDLLAWSLNQTSAQLAAIKEAAKRKLNK